MIYLLRIKAVSECMRIRRATLKYYIYNDREIDLSNTEHPLKQFGLIKVSNGKVYHNDECEELVVGEDVFFYRTNKVKSLNEDLIERVTMGIMLLPIDKEMEPHYLKAINEGYVFDQWNGEFEFLLGVMEELCLNNLVNAEKWYQKALSKGFTFKLNK